MKFRTNLVLLVLGTVLPLALFATAILYWNAAEQRRALAERMQETASALAKAVDREVQASVAALEGLAVGFGRAPEDLAALHQQAGQLVAKRKAWSAVMLLDRDGQLLVNTAVPFGNPLPNIGHLTSWRSGQDFQRPGVTGLIEGPVQRRPLVVVAVPILQDGTLRYALDATILADSLSDLLHEQPAPDRWFATIIDGRGTVIARSRDADAAVGRTVANFQGDTTQAGAGPRRAASLDGQPIYLASAPVAGTDWRVAYAIPADVIDQPFVVAQIASALTGAVLLATALAWAWLLGRRLARGMALLVEDAARLGRGITPDPGRQPPVHEVGAVRDAMMHAAATLNERAARQQRTEDQLRDAVRAAERADRAKSLFLESVNHDLRQPAQSLALFIGLLKTKLQGQPLEHTVDILQQSANALQGILDGMLDLSKIDAGLIRIEPATVPLTPVLRLLEREYAARAGGKGLRLRCVECGLSVRTDPALLERILRDLVENAVKYTERGGILIGCRRRGAGVEVQVVDTGPGIAPEQLEAIFEDYVQLGNPERDREKGLGLGLAVVRRLSAAMDHRVSVRSVPGRGSCFAVELPLAPAARVAATADAADPGVPFQGLVVVVEDDPHVRTALAKVLADWAFEVVEAADAAEAVGRLGGRSPALIVADYRLQDGHTGAEAIRTIRDSCRRQVPAIIVTGDTSPERLTAAQSTHALLLHKPVSPQDFRNAIERELRHA